ncbi:MAG TPA: hypothetical protein PLZ93_00825 [Nocardioides sp.]|uniref:hypothetical protein n=1 Tax=uncultured Nocardioides sp. TaxID=198441 RepID=UPI00261071C8|nr:hypothetical protein [uncultured Nocardioides sp.]HRI94136.1 hypothetical protein [Nocardioides sp.]HRK44081.1 hypothetical protein [Nocardioides sp.]
MTLPLPDHGSPQNSCDHPDPAAIRRFCDAPHGPEGARLRPLAVILDCTDRPSNCEILAGMLRRALSWDPPLVVAVLTVFAVVCTVSLAMTGSVTLFALFLASVCSAAQWLRKRRQAV